MDRFAHRKATRRLQFVDSTGAPLQNARLHATLTQHKFLFGAGVFDALEVVDDTLPEDRREAARSLLASWLALFRFGTLPFYWGRYEPQEGHTDAARMEKAVDWLLAQGVTLKGHPLCWHTNTVHWLLEKPLEEALALQLARITRDVGAFRGRIDMWDVINEVVIMPIFDKEDNAITRICRKLGRVEMVRQVFGAARAANPGATLLLNDFNVSPDYLRLWEDCLAAGIDIDALGIQSHQHQGFWGLEKLDTVLTRFESVGKPIHFTENTLLSGHLMPAHHEDLNDYRIPEWPTTPEGEDRQARELLEMVDFLFARPSVEAFTVWCMIDGRWLGAPAGLLRKDGSKKPAYDALAQRLGRDWHTDTDLVTDDHGRAELAGYKGDYALTLGARQGCLALDAGEDIITVTMA